MALHQSRRFPPRAGNWSDTNGIDPTGPSGGNDGAAGIELPTDPADASGQADASAQLDAASDACALGPKGDIAIADLSLTLCPR